ncbi:hypothetical protein [Kocuria rhizophila]|uniref:hypothetical protein n=1 Tax=Kocuria rhizophila TaxID=72000 RepID=UPI0021A6679F|nr:hypothetical protein [Kocuria rhizophila]MCT1917181.1 hypothetical protein [Kocuria rhizophila]MCT2249897.1 hypothetical protein [Kocuria rhizophila]
MTERPAPRTVVLVLADAPELPFVASALGLGFTAVSRDGWSAVVLPEGADPAGLAAAGDPRSIAVRLDSDGSARALRVYPPVAALDAHEDWGTQFDELEESTTLRWPAVHEDSVAGLLAGARDAAGSDGPPEDRGTGGDAAASAPGGNLTAAASIASLCDLDPAQTARLENYARTASSALLLESVLQLLGLPVVAAKIVEGQREVSELDGVTHHEPRPAALSVLDAASVEPSGSDVLSRLQRAYVRRPGLLLALGSAEAVLGAGLAGLAARGGRSAKVLGSASALMLSDAALQAALWASVRSRRKH